MTYQMAATSVTLNDLEYHSQVTCLFRCNPSNICAAFYTISTALADLLVSIGSRAGNGSLVMGQMGHENRMGHMGHGSLGVFTVRLHVMQRTLLLSEFCPSVCLSVRCVYCDKTKQRTANILIPHETAITVVFWHQQWLVGDAPFPLKSALKLTHPLQKTPTSTDFRS